MSKVIVTCSINMRLLFLCLFLSSCDITTTDNVTKTKGVVTGFYEHGNKATVKIALQDITGKVYFTTKNKCVGCLVNDSVNIFYHDNSLIENSGDVLEIDSCVKYYNATWKVEQVVKSLYFYDDSGLLIKKIDSTFIKN